MRWSVEEKEEICVVEEADGDEQESEEGLCRHCYSELQEVELRQWDGRGVCTQCRGKRNCGRAGRGAAGGGAVRGWCWRGREAHRVRGGGRAGYQKRWD